jgi:multiple sugar transport system permease protein
MSAVVQHGTKTSHRKTLGLAFSYGILVIVTILISLPAVWFVITSLKVDTEYLSYPIKFWPKEFQWVNYLEVFNPRYQIPKYAGRTLALSLAVSALTILSSSMGGFAFARFTDVPGRNRLFGIVIMMLMIPGIVMVIPQFIMYSRLHLTNTYWPWILGAATGSAYNIFLFRQFFLSFPRELEDAAEVDGCGPFRVFWQIFLPNAKPALATVFIFSFSGVWGDYYTPSIYLNNAKTLLAVRLAGSFVNPQGYSYTTLTLAANVLYTLPLIVMFFVGQKYILQGVVTSGLKG